VGQRSRTPLPQDYCASYESEVASLPEYFDAVRKISAYQKATNSRFVWRGAADATWGLHSSLVRRYQKAHSAEKPKEGALGELELEVIGRAQHWGLD
jgi:hypothetical protein